MRVMTVVLWGALMIGVLVLNAIAAPAQKVTLTMTEFQFTPKTASVNRGTTVELTLVNKGTVEHEFTLYPLPASTSTNVDMAKYAAENTYFKDIGTVEIVYPGLTATRKSSRVEGMGLNPGQSITIKFVAKKTGTFEFACHIPGHYEAGMKGALTVK